ncbi:TonB C-terminal domain-containing protein [Reyranella sp. CPCC 100927]|uniref:TonB C-terminal domain-containing protein n=1 Tax=Reyranella sp. CPCC 100927 TaxID=2599616 RepID=UPI0011B5DB8C|nr:TonB C-terminal domain-containing protein [Reyranella sp. CPCC 100927]TWT10571.1 hypothetical protein FQU96_15740 [Reyranella sp. CPCC 100927]
MIPGAGAALAAPDEAIAATSGSDRSPRNRLVAFDIPAQPLASALDRYGDATGREVLYSTGMVVSRRSMAVRGLLTPEAALLKLLEGTGLSPRFMADQSFVLVSTPDHRQTRGAAAAPALQQWYYARIQASLRQAFCWNSTALPGSYRVAVVFWLGPSGDVQRHERLSSTGAADLDARIDATLQRLTIGAPPPPGFVQPVLILIVPQAPDVTMGCGTDGAGHGPARSRR